MSHLPLLSPSLDKHAYALGVGYHYQHSGDHGAIGLALLASGQHECLQHNKSRHSTPSHSASNSISSTNQTNQTPRSPSTAQSSSTPGYHQSVPQPFAQPPSYQSAMSNPPSYSYQPGQYSQQYSAPQQPSQYVMGMQQ